MKSVKTSRTIQAPLEKVFQVIADPRGFQAAVADITHVEFLSEQQHGVGTRFRETRKMKDKEHSVVLEVTELVENDRIRIVSDEGGAVWDSVFTVEPQGDEVLMTLVMDVKPYKLKAKLTTPLIMGFVSKAIESDMDAVARYCEQS